MNRYGKSLDDVIDEMRAVAVQLIKYTFPNVSLQEEFEIDCLKQRRLTIDGYDVVVHLSQADYLDCIVESLEVHAADAPFLPMFLVCKIGAKFLGWHDLKYADTLRGGRKVYVWTVALDERGRPISLDTNRIATKTYEDFTFSYVAGELLT